MSSTAAEEIGKLNFDKLLKIMNIYKQKLGIFTKFNKSFSK